mmetsp:Transcript_50346/g.93092  ORF Transcript_50346/g.93092 Transcript_50346/m.93092 type:complete len:154 (+) Transcript_50346:140-601(+)
MATLFLLHGSPAGFALFQRKQIEEVGDDGEEIENDFIDANHFLKTANLVAWHPFKDLNDALEQTCAMEEGTATEVLVDFLEMHLPKCKNEYQLGVEKPSLSKALGDRFTMTHGPLVWETLRGCRFHLQELIKRLEEVGVDKTGPGNLESDAQV